MKYLIVDCETDGLLDSLTEVHSLVIENEDGTVFSCNDHGANCSIEDGLRLIMNGAADGSLIVMHNGIKFDYWALRKVYPWFELPIDQVRDTLVLARLLWADIGDKDRLLVKKGFPSKLCGSHSLKAWGYRLGVFKGDYSDTADWSKWTPEMQAYCEQDVTVTKTLWHTIIKKNPTPQSVELETWFAYILSRQEQFGYTFDVQGAAALYTKLLARRNTIDEELKSFFGQWFVPVETVVAKVSNKSKGLSKGVEYTKIKLMEFNPGSRLQIADRLQKLYGWKPEDFTDSGQPKIDETILAALSYPPCSILSERFMLDKRIGQIAEGEAAWLKLERNGRIHGSVNTIGAVTGRCTHSTPNMAQVPSVKAPYGKECRSLFHAPKGMVQVGCDASGLELRCLAHYMAKWDGGAYAKVLLEGDIHTVNQHAAGLPTRDDAKRFIYGYLYGAGDAKVGEIVGKGAAEGKKLKATFLRKTPALAKLKEAISTVLKKQKYLKGIDGRVLSVRSEHAALNTLLQSAGALLVKQATVNLYKELTKRGYQWGTDWAMVAHVHDEYQLHVREGLATEIARVAVWSFQQAGQDFNWRCPLDGEAKIGANWCETH